VWNSATLCQPANNDTMVAVVLVEESNNQPRERGRRKEGFFMCKTTTILNVQCRQQGWSMIVIAGCCGR
jgi:hypothetical protein